MHLIIKIGQLRSSVTQTVGYNRALSAGGQMVVLVTIFAEERLKKITFTYAFHKEPSHAA